MGADPVGQKPARRYSVCGHQVQKCQDRETGLVKQVEVPKRIKPWWFQSDEGKVCFSVRYGSWTIDLAKGKPSVEVESGEALVKALETIKIAVEAGELDSQIEIASAKLRSGFGK